MLLKKYKFPMNLFLIFEKINPIIYTSECLSSNHYIIFIPNEWYFSIIKCLKNEIFFASSWLIDQSSIDSKNYKKFLLDFKGKRLLTFNTFYFNFIKLKLTFFMNQDLNDPLISIENIYKNSNWIERENSEMFGVQYLFKKDVRNLLLDYSRNEYPLLKEFPCEGYYDVYYDFFEDQLQYIESEFVEL